MADLCDMKRVAHFQLIPVCLLLVVCGVRASAQKAGWNMITGIVMDQAGAQVGGAHVCAWKSGPIQGAIPCAKSTANGQFSISVDRADTYTISAAHFEKGYPEPLGLFFGKLWQRPTKVVVQENSIPEPVKIVLGPQAGRLVLRILDGKTNTPIEKGKIKLCRVNELNSCWSISTAFPKGYYELLTPEVPFTIKFETWHGPVPEYHGGVASGPSGDWEARNAFDDKGLPLDVLHVDLGQRKELTVRLK
jgi:hypothetical protein